MVTGAVDYSRIVISSRVKYVDILRLTAIFEKITEVVQQWGESY